MNVVDIRDAAGRIHPHIHLTPLIHSLSFSQMSGAEIFLKAENLQKTGSFKVRGAFNKLIQLRESQVIAASMGNHAQAVAFAASRLGKEATIVMPETVALNKEEATRSYGARVVLHGTTLTESLQYAREQQTAFIHPFDDPQIIAGQGTIGLELCRQLENIDTILVPVGGGGLIAGIACAVKELSPATRIIGIQTEAAPSASRSFTSGTLTAQQPAPTLADGIAVGQVGRQTLAIMNQYVDEMMLVDENRIAEAILLLMERKKLVVEGAGAVPLAALLQYPRHFQGRRVILLISGGNIDFTVVDHIIHRGLAANGRITIITLEIQDVPGSLHKVTGIIADQRGNILNVHHERLVADLPFGFLRAAITIETRGPGHGRTIAAQLENEGYTVLSHQSSP
ncbi:MAG: threonine ammonia-lyase [Deltaproteobacteria bacterium]|nr:threonine ammonia-lyase [Candidatus Anaeroferrophillus wilburensis]MBN2888401.1 threonine ammonia-lyase [Deltaproteobacteria bacterium]